MSICVFSKKGILYQDNKTNAVLAVAVPATEQKRQYADISNPSARVIKERYGVLSGEVLFRNEAGIVNVYGQLPEELYEEKREVKVYLPEDLAPLDVNVLYYVIGDGLIVHSVRNVDVDGSSSWSSIFIELEKNGAGILNVVENLISERIVSINDEKILVSYTNLSHELKEELYTRVNQYGVLVEPLEKLNAYKSKTPVYAHKDNSIIMLIFMIIAAMLFILSIAYYGSANSELSQSEDRILDLRKELKESISKKRLKKVTNPQDIKDYVEKPFKARPSAIIHAAAEVSSLFGLLQTIQLEKRMVNKAERSIENVPHDNIVYVIATVKSSSKNLLIDQERLAKSVYESRKWIRSIERANLSSEGVLSLKIGVYVGD